MFEKDRYLTHFWKFLTGRRFPPFFAKIPLLLGSVTVEKNRRCQNLVFRQVSRVDSRARRFLRDSFQICQEALPLGFRVDFEGSKMTREYVKPVHEQTSEICLSRKKAVTTCSNKGSPLALTFILAYNYVDEASHIWPYRVIVESEGLEGCARLNMLQS